MSKPMNSYDSRARLPLVLCLLGTLAFSLSTLPGKQKSEAEFRVTSLPSEFAADDISRGANDAKVLADVYSQAGKTTANTKAARDKAEKLKEKRRRIEICEITESGDDVPAKDVAACHVKKFDKMNVEDATEYYEDNILPEIRELLSADNLRDQSKGLELLKKLKASGAGDRIVKSSIASLMKINQAKIRLLGMSRNDVRRPKLLDVMRDASYQSDRYFPAQAVTLGWPYNAPKSYELFPDDFKAFRDRMDSNYEELLRRQRDMLFNPAFTVGAPPMTNSAPSQPWPGKFDAAPAPTTPPQASRAPVQQQKSAIPRVGAPVR